MTSFVILQCRACEQERIERERIKESVPLDLFARPEKLSNSTEDAREVAEVLGSFSNAQRIITGKASCIGIDYQVCELMLISHMFNTSN